MASSPPKSDPKNVNTSTRIYGSAHHHQHKATCTRRMAQWLDDLPDPSRRSRFLNVPVPLIVDKQEQRGHFEEYNEDAQLDYELSALPHDRHGQQGQHENPLRQHPISLVQFPIRLRIPQRRSSLNFSQQSSHQDLRMSAPIGPQLAFPQTNFLLYLGHPQQTTTTGLHLNYAKSNKSLRRGSPLQTVTPGIPFNYPQDIITRPGPAVLAQGHAPILPPGSQRSYVARLLPSVPQISNDHKMLVRFGPVLQQPVPLSELTMQDQKDPDRVRDEVVTGPRKQIPSVEAVQATTLHRQGSQICQLFGRDTAKQGESRKRDRSDTPATMASLPPTKRVRGAITSARHRLSTVMKPDEDGGGDGGGGGGGEDGRQSRVVSRLTEAAKRMSLSPQPRMIRVVDLAPGVVKETVKIAVLGNTGVGKTKLVQTFRAGTYREEESMVPKLYQMADDGYVVDTINVVLDGVPVALETWDVSSQCDGDHAAHVNSIRPLLATFYDVVIICFDVSDEATLKAAESKWARNAERFCTGAPTVLLGLKTDLRRPFPSLRLAHLQEPTQTSTGQGEAAGKKMVVEAFYEASAKTGEGVDDFFESIIRFALQRRRRRHRRSQSQSRGAVSRVVKTLKGLKKGLKKNVD